LPVGAHYDLAILAHELEFYAIGANCEVTVLVRHGILGRGRGFFGEGVGVKFRGGDNAQEGVFFTRRTIEKFVG
jgi:hypothetical protein